MGATTHQGLTRRIEMMHYFPLTHKSIACYFQLSHTRNRGLQPSICHSFYHFEPKLIENQRRPVIFILIGFFKHLDSWIM
jgi:hypothetical protein